MKTTKTRLSSMEKAQLRGECGCSFETIGKYPYVSDLSRERMERAAAKFHSVKEKLEAIASDASRAEQPQPPKARKV